MMTEIYILSKLERYKLQVDGQYMVNTPPWSSSEDASRYYSKLIIHMHNTSIMFLRSMGQGLLILG